MIQVEHAQRLLRPWLGQALLDCTNLCEDVALMLDDFDVMHGDYGHLAEELKRLIFRTVHAITRGDLTVFRDNGARARIRMEDFDIMADSLLYLVFHTLVHSAWNCSRIREFALSHDSLSAIRALYVDFAEFQTAEEKAMLAYTARTCHPSFRYRAWLKDDEDTVQ